MALLRDWTKKTILGSRVLRFAGGFQGPSAAILMFHSVLRDPAREFDSLGGIVHSEPVFRAQMEMLARNYHPISLDDAIKHLSDGKDLPKRSVVVTFDDGDADPEPVRRARDILRDRGLRREQAPALAEPLALRLP